MNTIWLPCPQHERGSVLVSVALEPPPEPRGFVATRVLKATCSHRGGELVTGDFSAWLKEPTRSELLREKLREEWEEGEADAR